MPEISGHSGVCDCFGQSITLTTNTMLIVLFGMGLLSLVPLFPSAKDNRPKEIANAKRVGVIASCSILLLAGALRFHRIEKDLSQGLTSNTSSSGARHRIESILASLTPFGQTEEENKPKIYLMLRSPGCEPCTSEMLFWNSEKYRSRYKFVALFPSDSASSSTKMSAGRYLKFDLSNLSRDIYQEIAGAYPPFVTRIALSPAGTFLSASKGGDGDSVRKQFAQLVDSLMSNN